MPDTQTFPIAQHTVNRMGYGAMQLAGPHVFGPPRDRDAALAVLMVRLPLAMPRMLQPRPIRSCPASTY